MTFKIDPKDPKGFMQICIGVAVLVLAIVFLIGQLNAMITSQRIASATQKYMETPFPFPFGNAPSEPPGPTVPGPPAEPSAAGAAASGGLNARLRVVSWSFGQGETVQSGSGWLSVEAGSLRLPVYVVIQNPTGQLAGTVSVRIDGYLNGAKVVTDTIYGKDIPPNGQKRIEGEIVIPPGVHTDHTTATITEAAAGPASDF